MPRAKSKKSPGMRLANGMLIGSAIGIVYGVLILGPALSNNTVGLIIGIALGTGTGAGIGAAVADKEDSIRPQTKRERQLARTIILLGFALLGLTIAAIFLFNN